MVWVMNSPFTPHSLRSLGGMATSTGKSLDGN